MNTSASGYATTCRRVDGWTATLNSSTKSRTSRRDWSAGRTLGDWSLNKVLNAHGCLLRNVSGFNDDSSTPEAFDNKLGRDS